MTIDTLINAPSAGTLADAVGDEGWPGAQGSPACCAVLQALYRAAPTGLNRQDLQAFTALDDESFAAALAGLSRRRRVECVHAGRYAVYRVVVPTSHLPDPAIRVQ
jgi:hypothetical protein